MNKKFSLNLTTRVYVTRMPYEHLLPFGLMRKKAYESAEID